MLYLVHDPSLEPGPPDARLDELENVRDLGLAFECLPDARDIERLRDRGHPWGLLIRSIGHEAVPRLNLAAGDPDYRRRTLRVLADLIARASANGASMLELPAPMALEESELPGRPGTPIPLHRARDHMWRSLDELASLTDTMPLRMRVASRGVPHSTAAVEAENWDAWMDHLGIPHLGLSRHLDRPPPRPEEGAGPGRWDRSCRFAGKAWNARGWACWAEALEVNPGWSRLDWCVGIPPRMERSLLRELRHLRGRYAT